MEETSSDSHSESAQTTQGTTRTPEGALLRKRTATVEEQPKAVPDEKPPTRGWLLLLLLLLTFLAWCGYWAFVEYWLIPPGDGIDVGLNVDNSATCSAE